MASVDSAVMWPNGPNGKIYFFSAGQYYSYDIANEQMDSGDPKPIQGNWPGLTSNIRLDIVNNKMAPGYPLMIQENWSGPRVTGNRFTAGFVWPKPVDGKMKAYYMQYDIEDDKVDPNYPQPMQGWGL